MMTFPGRFSCQRLGSIMSSVVAESNKRNRSSLADAQSAQMRSSRTVCNGCTRPSSQGRKLEFLVALVILLRGPSGLLRELFPATCAVGNELCAPSMSSGCDCASLSTFESIVWTLGSCLTDNDSVSIWFPIFAASVAVAQKLTGIVEDVEWPQPKNMNSR